MLIDDHTDPCPTWWGGECDCCNSDLSPEKRKEIETMVMERVIANDPIEIIVEEIRRSEPNTHDEDDLTGFARGAHAFRAWVMTGQQTQK